MAQRLCIDVLLSSWHYHWLRYSDHMRSQYPVVDYCCKFDEWGYEQIPASSIWTWHLNHKDTVRFAKNYISQKSLKGFMAAPRMHTTKKNYYTLLNDASEFVFSGGCFLCNKPNQFLIYIY